MDAKRPLAIGFFIFIAAFVVLAFWAGYRNNQFVGPLPDLAQPSPLVPELPDIVGRLRETKTVCEGRAADAKTLLSSQGERRIRRRNPASPELAIGKRKYDAVRAELSQTTSYLRVGMLRRFNTDDPEEVRQQLEELQLAASDFIAWSNELDIQTRAGGDPLAEIGTLVIQWLQGISQENDQVIQALIAELERCEMCTWEDAR